MQPARKGQLHLPTVPAARGAHGSSSSCFRWRSLATGDPATGHTHSSGAPAQGAAWRGCGAAEHQAAKRSGCSPAHGSGARRAGTAPCRRHRRSTQMETSATGPERGTDGPSSARPGQRSTPAARSGAWPASWTWTPAQSRGQGSGISEEGVIRSCVECHICIHETVPRDII